MLRLNGTVRYLHILQARGNEYTVGEIANAVDRPIEIECLHLYYAKEVDVCDEQPQVHLPI